MRHFRNYFRSVQANRGRCCSICTKPPPPPPPPVSTYLFSVFNIKATEPQLILFSEGCIALLMHLAFILLFFSLSMECYIYLSISEYLSICLSIDKQPTYIKLQFIKCAFKIVLIILLSCSTGMVDSINFQQDPHLIVSQTAKAKIPCSHNDRTLTFMLQYRQERDSTNLTLISYGRSAGTPFYEPGFTERFEMTRQDVLSGELSISNSSLSDSAVYYCAARIHSATFPIICLLKCFQNLVCNVTVRGCYLTV